MDALQFQWDEINKAHLVKHEVRPKEAEQVILNRPVDIESQLRNGEERTIQLGETDAGRILVVVSTNLDSMIRVITAWPAKQRLRHYFSTQKKNGHVGRIEKEDLRE